ncbi:MAG: DUF4292 domain-containing protein [Chlorobiaceae bacterium]|jgi:hypothetical protein|nr:DUF4292 domain-containing protein [Chlorobiaceae bacterium]NTV17480.1 DUF4292 domain-containing protein [Chlorobiaceae bacterium]
MKGKRMWVWMLFMLLLGGGCTDFRTVGRQEMPAEQTALIAEHSALYREVAEASPFIESLDGYADVWIKTPKRQNRVFCNILINRGGEARMIVSAGILGWPVADLFFSRDSLYVHDMLNNRLFQGSNNELNLEKILGVNSGYRLLSESLLGLVKITEPSSAIRTVKKGSGKLSFTLATRTGTKEVVIDPSNRTLSALLLKDRQGKTTTEIHFRNFETISKDGHTALVPKDIEMVLYNSNADGTGDHQLVISYDDRVFNQRNRSLKFLMPKKVKVVNLDDAQILPWM